jgi:aminopeptidase N
LRDSSYAVESAAIEALAKLPSVNARAQIATLENTANSGLIVAIASYYAQRGSIEQYSWFLRRMPDLTDVDLYTYLQAFGAFMVQMPVIEREKGIHTLEAMARTHPQYVVRLGAYRGLMALAPSQPELKSVLLDIKTKETDERLKAYYNLM